MKPFLHENFPCKMTSTVSWLLIFLCIFSQNLCGQINPTNNCKRAPVFAAARGFSKNVAIITSMPDKKGLLLADPANMGKTYQDSSWASQGYMGQFTTDDAGNIFVLPGPHVNLIDNPIASNNYVFKIDSRTGKLFVFAQLPNLANDQSPNAFGVLGITYNCKHKCLYISSVNNSTRKNEVGKIYQLNAVTGEIMDSLISFDAYGLLTIEIDDQEVLLSGCARNSNVYEIKLNKKGGFNSDPKEIISIAGFGPRGDDRVKKIEFDMSTFRLIIKGHEFNYNLSAPLENQQTQYTFSRNGDNWLMENVKK
jgi:hypothetical protein